MRLIDYMVCVSGKDEREKFYNEMHEKGYKDHMDTKEEIINSSYPFAISLKRKKIMVIPSATQCYLMDRAGKVLNIDDFNTAINKIC